MSGLCEGLAPFCCGNPSCPDHAGREAVIATLAAHDGRAQNTAGDWLCACGAFLCPPNDERLDSCHRDHLATILIRRHLTAEADR